MVLSMMDSDLVLLRLSHETHCFRPPETDGNIPDLERAQAKYKSLLEDKQADASSRQDQKKDQRAWILGYMDQDTSSDESEHEVSRRHH